MSYENKGSMPITIYVTREPDRSGNYVCTGVNDHVEIQLALNETNRIGGGIVHLSPGDYDIQAQLTIYKNTTLEGEGSLHHDTVAPYVQTTLVLNGLGAYGIVFQAAQNNVGIKIRNLNIVGDRTAGQGGIYANGAIHCVFKNLHIYNVTLYALVLEVITGATVGYNNRIDHVQAWRCGAGFTENLNEENTYIDCYAGQCDGRGFVLEKALSHLTNCKVVGWPAESKGTIGFEVTASSTGRYVFTGCMTDNVWEKSLILRGDKNVVIGFKSYSCSQEGAGIHEDIQIAAGTNNVIDGCTCHGTNHLYGVNDASTGGNVISNSIITGTTSACVRIAGADNCLVEGCHLEGSGHGVHFTSGSLYCIAQGNQGKDLGAKFIFVEGSSHYALIDGNVGNNPGTVGVEVEDSNYCGILNNIIDGAGVYGIFIDGTASYNRISDNTTTNGVSGCVKVDDATCVSNDFSGGNSFYEGGFSDIGTGTILPTIDGEFNKFGGGSAGITAPVINTSPGGIDIDADNEFCYVDIPLPTEIQQVVRIKIWAYSNVIEADNNMLLRIIAHGATSSELWSGNPIDVVNHPSEETGGIVQFDVIHWVIDASDDAQVGTLAAQDLVELMAVGEAAVAPDIITDALFGGWEIEYV